MPARCSVDGSVEVSTFPLLSTATHNEVDGHLTAIKEPPGSTLTARQPDNAEPGFVDVSTFPPLSTATQSEIDGHERPVGVPGSIRPSDRQA